MFIAFARGPTSGSSYPLVTPVSGDPDHRARTPSDLCGHFNAHDTQKLIQTNTKIKMK